MADREIAAPVLGIAPALRKTVPSWLAVSLGLMSLSIFINYIDRGNLATAAPIIKDELHLSATQLGFLLTAFFISYAPMQIVVGWLVDRFDAARVLLAGFVVWSIATALTGFAHGFASLLMIRLLLGVGESVAFPTYAKLLANNFSESQRGLSNACIMSGMAAGPAFGIFFGGMLIAAFGWRSFFIGFGVLSLLWVIPWLMFAQPSLATGRNALAGTIPGLRRIVRERSMWGAGVGQFCANYGWYFILTWVPYYLVHERHWSIPQMATIGGIAYLLMASSIMLCGWLSDRWIARGTTATHVRKTFLGAGTVLVAVFLMGCVLSNASYSIAFLMLSCVAAGMISPHIFAVAQTLAGPLAAGRWTGLQNMFGNFAGIIAPALAGILVDRTGSFLAPFALAAIISVVGGVAWVFIMGPVVQIDWSDAAKAPLR